MPEPSFDFQVDRADLTQHRLLAPRKPGELADGQVLLHVERFALSSLNLAYGRADPVLPFFRLFPAPPPWGRLPVWGFAQVRASAHPGVGVGERVFGCLPMTSWLLVQPGRHDAAGFVDDAEWRRALPAFYSTYSRTAADPTYRVAFEDPQMLLQPTFTSAFAFERHLAGLRDTDVRQIVLSAASSKSAAALAFVLRDRRRLDLRIVGLTSATHRRFAQGLGFYDEIVDYGKLSSMTPNVSTAFIDFTADAHTREAMRAHFGSALRFVARTSGPASRQDDDACAFGPAKWRALLAEIDLNALRGAMTGAWSRFLDASAYWLRIDQHRGADALIRLYDALLAGRADTARGHVIVM